MTPTELSDEDRERFKEMVRDYGMLGILNALANICHHFATDYDPCPATQRYEHAERDLRELADYLDRGSSAQ